MRKILGAALAAMLTAGAANATITLNMSGTRSTGSTITGTSDTFTLTMIYDELTPVQSGVSSSSYDNARYVGALQSMTFSSGSYTQTMQASTSSTNTFDISNYKTSGSDTVRTNLQNSSQYLRLNLAAMYTTLDSTSMFDLTDYAWTNKSLVVTNAGSAYTGIVTSMTSGTSSVPEPSTWGMMLVGFGVIGYSMRRQRKVEVSFG